MNNRKRLNCGVIGVGRLGYQHAMNLARNNRANLVAVADPNEDARDLAVQDFGIEKTYDDYHKILEDPDIQGVVIATPTKQHYKVLVDAINAGKSIFVEKPITYTVEEAEKILEQVNSTNTYLQVGFMRRFDPGHVSAKQMIEAGEIGQPIYIHDCQRDPNGPPKHYVPESGGLFVDMGIHDLDCVRWLMNDEIVSIYAQGAVLKHQYLKEMDDVDQGHMLITFANNTLADIEISRNANDIYDVRTEVIGTKSSVYIGQHQLTPFVKVNGQGMTYNLANWCLGRFEKAYELEIAAFVDGVLNGEESPVDAFDGMIGLKLAMAATASYKQKAVVKIE
ncbi:MAG: Gfo/Idh/MocA family oxidoreductase [Desulfobacterales bacterium]|jgi:scyllo-inositol 2-dehydrogenase (NAD+)